MEGLLLLLVGLVLALAVAVPRTHAKLEAQPLRSRNVFTENYDDSSTPRFVPQTSIHIGGLFPLTGESGWLGGQGCLPAARMALNDVNNEPYLLPGYRLVMHWNDSQCNPGLGATVLYDLIYNEPKKVLVLGGCSIVCSTVAETASMYNLVVVGYGSSSPALSNRERFPTFFRTHPSATIHNPTRVELFKRFQWTRIAILIEAEEVFVSTGKDLELRCKAAGIEVVSRVSFLTDAADAVRSLARQDARIIVGMFYSGAARKVMCEAYKQNLFGKQYVWFLIGWYEDNWWHPGPGTNCTKEEMREVTNGHFTTEALMLNQDSKLTIAGMTAIEWRNRYHKEYAMDPENNVISEDWKPSGYQEAPLAYDAIWAVALALNKTIERLTLKGMRIEDFNYDNAEIAREIQDCLRQVQFLGVSGQVAFSDKGDRIAWTQIEQMIDGKYNLLGYYDTQTDNLTWFNREQWLATGRPPPDRTIIKAALKTVSNALFLSLSVISGIGILMALILIFFNYRFRQFRYIQMSYPMTNNMMLWGCILCFSSVFFFGLDGKKIPTEFFTLMCNARAWTLSLGFSLCFGAMFSKTWISYRLSTSSSKSKKIKESQTYIMLAVFCALDAIILVVWHFQSPMIRNVEVFELENPEGTEEDIKIQPQLEHCDANLVWYGIIYGYKGLLCIFGLFLAYETRSVKLKQLNDSRLVGMSVYNVVVLCMITAPVSLVITSQENAHFAFVAVTIIFCCYLSMGLVFAPKITEIVKRRGAHGFAHGNGTFHDTMTSKEEEEKIERLIQEQEELKSKIKEKEQQIEEANRKLEELTKEKAAKKDGNGKATQRKAVRIQEPVSDLDIEIEHKDLDVHLDPVSDSGYHTSTRTPSRPSDFELSESYL